MAVARVLKHSTPSPDRSQCRLETPAVVAKLVQVGFSSAAVPKAAPPLAWRMGHYRVRPGVFPCVPRFVPGVNLRLSEIDSICFYIQCCYHDSNWSKVNNSVISPSAGTSATLRLVICGVMHFSESHPVAFAVSLFRLRVS